MGLTMFPEALNDFGQIKVTAFVLQLLFKKN
jgi:hypothetical protein